ncbi:molybdate ABC transporter substrate-binding protein [Undibacterium sp. Jales W-56]|uniref:molybdate ABC transporter substrate-binding protein n=1 Tax=Undibacterium sp. Jales W-56 TaxID=2897325 RepID=UPI0021CFBCCD|nr:molybdate ABC transporter substrate-binding protein [Undibacterium sp. Jales W-56]MCU6435854.1 molybdate ABC transporter substrate-binding protein [Undibacterium sp. Jales W-56]
MKIRALIFLLLSSVLAHTAQAETIAVAVAANVQYVFNDLKAEFKKETGHEIQASFNSSGKFVTQIMNGAPFDVFLSADMAFPDKLHKEGFSKAPPKVYAYGALVLWTRKDVDLGDWQSLLMSKSIDKIAIANPTTAPYGREAMNSLHYYKLAAALQAKLVFGESIAQTNQYIHSRAADIGFTAKSVVLSPEMKGQGKWIDVPVASYQPIAQGALILNYGKEHHPEVAQQFFDFIYSVQARAIFARYGYLLP